MTSVHRKPFVIAIDGPAAAGKGTLARRIAEHYGFAYLDSGSLYRAVALALLEAGRDPHDEEAAVAAARTLDPAILTRPDLRREDVGEAASIVAAMPAVREALLAFQRDFARHPPAGAPGVVIDGRDIGTVVCPDADIKLYVTASDAERARRRQRELAGRGEAVDFATVLADLRRRDERDASRATAPLKPADDAVLLDTTEMDIDAVFAAARRIIDSRLQARM
ncbi:MAG: (d)CMP kinase [Alphaproteobacteria bacterium]|nr:MAG: (d)CMP kinase [Alphaproteobacteria bacterium]